MNQVTRDFWMRVWGNILLHLYSQKKALSAPTSGKQHCKREQRNSWKEGHSVLAPVADRCSAADQLRVEAALTAYYLHSDGAFGAGPLRYIDASESQLRMALNIAQDADPVRLLAAACGGPAAMIDALANGVVPFKPKPGLPGFFRFLVMTCAIVATADNNDSTQEFGENLARAFGTQNPFNNRSSLPDLWLRLQDWCDEAHAAGEAIRQVMLPPPGTGKHLGLTNAITFPSWRDVKRLRQLLDRRSEYRSIVDPVGAAIQLAPLVENDASFSSAMRQASTEYRQLYLSKASLLGLHRFWVALAGLLRERHSPTAERFFVPRLELRFGATLDDVELRVVLADMKGNVDPLQVLEDFPDLVLAQTASWTSQRVGKNASEALVSAISRGGVPFVESRFGVWHSSLLQPSVPTRCLLLLSKQNRDVALKWGVSTEPIGDEWRLAGPIPARDCRSVYQYLGRSIEPAGSPSQAMMLVGEHRTGSGLLGRESLLPQIRIAGPGAVTLRPVQENGVKCQLRPDSEDLYSIVTDTPLEGAYKLRLDEDVIPSAEPLAIETSVVFFRDALEHAKLGDIDESTWRRREEARVRSTPGPIVVTDLTDDCPPVDSERSARFQDCLEALYAGGRAGWSEQELVTTMRAVLGDNALPIWDILRGLMECGWLRPTSNLRWRARRWWLTPPSLIKIRNTEGIEGLLLVGSAPANIRRRFQQTAQAAGCTVMERPGASEYTACMQLARGPALGEVVEELGWVVTERPICTPMAAPDCWPPENVDESRHRRVGRWNWDSGGFRSRDATNPGPVSLERFRRERGDRDDIFVVTGPGSARYVSTCRTSAIVEAYRRARIAMFRWDGARLVRNSEDGHLVEPLANLAMLSSCRSPGPALVDGRWTYVYDMTADCVGWIRSVFGQAFVDDRSALDTKLSSPSAEAVGWSRNRNVFRIQELTPPPIGRR
ncbi:hypothetical protein [Burkholderia sp. Ac-20344]|uniref:hypothetical protein n=1 Tax=Burkholderia sp. Ac-20344 TaxID=2703890 RepID=UPI00197BFDE8|nr:hypothetical protein [Burkholderia sp. Ac-20344]MBN3831590.1 hypothetical protein [Burkholderia sp. Ac-20344]